MFINNFNANAAFQIKTQPLYVGYKAKPLNSHKHTHSNKCNGFNTHSLTPSFVAKECYLSFQTAIRSKYPCMSMSSFCRRRRQNGQLTNFNNGIR